VWTEHLKFTLSFLCVSVFVFQCVAYSVKACWAISVVPILLRTACSVVNGFLFCSVRWEFRRAILCSNVTDVARGRLLPSYSMRGTF
jgi:hypothetical protein